MQNNNIKEISEIPREENTFLWKRISLNKREQNQKIIGRKNPYVKKCIYYKDLECSAPSSFFEICKACPYGYARCFGKIVRNIFNKTIGIAISMMENKRFVEKILDKRNR